MDSCVYIHGYARTTRRFKAYVFCCLRCRLIQAVSKTTGNALESNIPVREKDNLKQYFTFQAKLLCFEAVRWFRFEENFDGI
jgi:hypothetical protein